MKTLKTDVIIPAYRPGEEFEKLLERLSAQKYPINKILVMNTEKKFWKETWEQEYRPYRPIYIKELNRGLTP